MTRLLRELYERVWLWWWHLWTGDRSEAETRRRIEEEARRYGGQVAWSDEAPWMREP